jgi:hypothetical protein
MKILLSMAALLAMTAGSALGQTGNPWFLLHSRSVWKDLSDWEVSDEVLNKLVSLNADSELAKEQAYQDAGINSREFPFPNAPGKQVKYQEIKKTIDEEFRKKGMELLTADQQKRFQQIHFQHRLRQDSQTALLSPDVASELKLTDDQIQKLKDQRRDFSQSLGQGKTIRGLHDEHNPKAIDLLTAEQKEMLDNLKGNEVNLSVFFPRTIPRKFN